MSLNRLFVLVLLLIPAHLFSQVISIAQARNLPPGTNVMVRGVVTTGSELGKIRYLQDGTAGIAAFPGTGSQPGFDTTVQPGDSIEVVGTTVLFHGLLEISPIADWQIISSGNPLPAPAPVSISQLSDALESRLVSIECAAFGDAGGIFANAGTYNVSDSEGGSVYVYLRGGHPLQNTAIPGAPVRLTAVLSEYDGFQLLPRSGADFSAASCFYFSEQPDQSDIQTTGFKVSWSTNLPATAQLRFGGTPQPLNEIDIPAAATVHSFELTGLASGQIYWVQIKADHNGETILSKPVPFATRSQSSGQIKVFFNHSIDESVANGLLPAGQSTAAVLAETIARIDAAEQTIDVAMYNINRSDIVTALEQAVQRGVQVRYLAAFDASNTALDPAPAFPVLYGNEEALMHDKIMVVDAGLANKCWVMSGSLNWTNANMNNDFNNTLFIQDQSLARTYELEFEEMWGSEGALPDPANSRFGSAKTDNTPHHFVINGIPVESYFSPSDGVTRRITDAIRTADAEALFALFTYTKDEPSEALVEVMNSGVPVRGMIENINDVGAEYNWLLAQGVNVQHHSASGDLHHKYAVLDAVAPGSAPVVVTGSHNWSLAAETVNDENTLVIHDAGIALLYKAEFEKRWSETVTATQAPAFRQVSAFPNPVSDVLQLQFGSVQDAEISVRDLLGKTVLQTSVAGRNQVALAVENLLPGFYFAVIESRHGLATVSFQKL